MAGTITVSTISDGSVSTSSTNCIQGSAKAWVKININTGTTTATIGASYNVSSVTYSATGIYTVAFTNAFADTNYAVTAIGSPNGTLMCASSPSSASSYPLLTVNSTTGNGYAPTSGFIYASFFR
jgi:hypothetical protein